MQGVGQRVEGRPNGLGSVVGQVVGVQRFQLGREVPRSREQVSAEAAEELGCGQADAGRGSNDEDVFRSELHVGAGWGKQNKKFPNPRFALKFGLRNLGGQHEVEYPVSYMRHLP